MCLSKHMFHVKHSPHGGIYLAKANSSHCIYVHWCVRKASQYHTNVC